MIIVVRILVGDGTWISLIETESSVNATRPSLGRRSTNGIYYADGTGLNDAGSITSADNWMVVGYNRPAGASQTVTVHKCLLGSASNTHTAIGTTFGNESGSIANYRIGSDEDRGNIRVVAAAIFTTSLTNANFEGVASAKTSQSILDLGPIHMWESNSTNLTEDVVGTADMTATGTTTSTDGPAGWTYFGGAAATSLPVRRRYSGLVMRGRR